VTIDPDDLRAMEGESSLAVLGEPPSEQECLIAELATLGPLGYGQRRKEIAKQLGVPLRALDQEVKRARTALRKGFEHSNGARPSPTGIGAFDRSNACSNETDSNALYEVAKGLIEAEDPFALVRIALAAGGYAGDTSPAELAYLAVSSRFMPRPINLHIEAPSSAGKNHAVDSALALHPAEAFYKVSASSPRALVYNNESFKNRAVVLGEADSIPAEGSAASALHSIANDAVMAYETVEKDPETGQYVTRTIRKEGPTGFITTGIWPLDDQMGTRCLTVTLLDDPEQTREVLRIEAKQVQGDEPPPAVEVEKFHAYQRWLATAGEKRVVVPFALVLSNLVPVGAVRIRRDFKQLLSVIQTLAFLAQRHRPRNSAGAVIAAQEDYRRARTLLAPLFDSIAAEGITSAIRKTVEAVSEVEEVSEAELSRRLGLTKSTIHYRVGRALRGGWLKNFDTRSGYPARLVRADPLPEARSALPTVEELVKAFESKKGNSNGYSNSPETLVREGVGEGAFECSSDFPKVDAHDDPGIELYPDDSPTHKEERGS
jgi:hypothetical protein